MKWLLLKRKMYWYKTQYYVQGVVFETQPKANVDTQPRDVATGHKYGGFIQPDESEGDDYYLSYSQFSSQLSEIGVQLVLMGLNLPVQTKMRSGWVMMMTVLLVPVASIIGSGNQ
jgi:hypothetical protein